MKGLASVALLVAVAGAGCVRHHHGRGHAHGHVHGTEMAPDESAMLYSIGFVIATGLLHAVGIALRLIHRWDVGRVLLRAAGSVVLGGGLYFLWSALG